MTCTECGKEIGSNTKCPVCSIKSADSPTRKGVVKK